LKPNEPAPTFAAFIVPESAPPVITPPISRLPDIVVEPMTWRAVTGVDVPIPTLQFISFGYRLLPLCVQYWVEVAVATEESTYDLVAAWETSVGVPTITGSEKRLYPTTERPYWGVEVPIPTFPVIWSIVKTVPKASSSIKKSPVAPSLPKSQ